jgi:2-polyprenyl-3-methyl-5-hydroxy-6-metoxy-1,4-benzoquinol methylase
MSRKAIAMKSRYPIKYSKYSSHAFVTKYINESKPTRILDLGCGNGELTAPFVSQEIVVYGIEIDSGDCLSAERKGIRASNQSLDSMTIFPVDKCDVIIAADILEHLQDPDAFLHHLRNWIENDATIIVSIPNVANIFVRVSLLFGQFNYSDRGILDRTHLRFFTRKTLLAMFRSNLFEFKFTNYTPIPIGEVIPKWVPRPLTNSVESLLWMLAKIAPTLFAYQFIGHARI